MVVQTTLAIVSGSGSEGDGQKPNLKQFNLYPEEYTMSTAQALPALPTTVH